MTMRALVLLTLTLLLAGCGRNVEQVAERQINGLLPTLVGPADKYATRVRGRPDALLRGRMRSVHIEGEGVGMAGELTLDTLILDLTGVSVDMNAKRLSGIESITFSATLGEENLNRYVRSRRPDIFGLQVALGRSGATVSARPEIFGGISAPIAVEGVMRPRPGGSLLDFIPAGARVSVVPVPAPALRYLADRLNPVVDLSTLRVPVRVERAEIRQGALLLSGTVDPAALLQEGPLRPQ